MKKTIILIIAMTLLSSVFTYGDIHQLYRQGFVEGYLREPLGEVLEIESYEGEIYYLPLSPDAKFYIDAYLVEPSNFLPGMEIYAELQGRSVTQVEGYSTNNLGYIPPGSKIRTGRIARIQQNQLVLKLGTGAEETFFTTPGTLVLRKGSATTLDTLYEGDRVKLYFDEAHTNIISRIHVQGDSIKVKGLYKGRLKMADAYEDKITVGDLEQLNNGTWTSQPSLSIGNPALSPIKTIQYNRTSPLYVGGYPISHDHLKYYSGKTVYMAIKDFFGREQAERMVVQNQYESTYSDKIQDINWFTGELELKNKRNIRFNEGTMVIKNDRMVDTFALSPNADVFIVADGRGLEATADVIYVLNEDINNSNMGQHYIYAGRMDQIVEDRLWLRDFFLLEENNWQSFEGEKELYFDNDTDIYDLTNNKKLTLKEFYSGNYAIDEDSRYARDNRLRDWHAYIYTQGDRISAILVQKNMDSLLRQRVTNGLVASVSQDPLIGWKIELTNTRDWSSLRGQWMERNSNLAVSLEKALLIKDGRQIAPHDLRAGDRLYLVRDDFYGKVIIVK